MKIIKDYIIIGIVILFVIVYFPFYKKTAVFLLLELFFILLPIVIIDALIYFNKNNLFKSRKRIFLLFLIAILIALGIEMILGAKMSI